jgi:predicted nucleic acid-binding protein
VKIDSSPIYLDTSAVAKLFLPEPDSDAVESVLRGRRDLYLSDLAVTELTSVLVRRVRERSLDGSDARKLHRRLLRDHQRLAAAAGALGGFEVLGS